MKIGSAKILLEIVNYVSSIFSTFFRLIRTKFRTDAYKISWGLLWVRENRCSKKVVRRGVNEFLSVLSVFTVRYWWNASRFCMWYCYCDVGYNWRTFFYGRGLFGSKEPLVKSAHCHGKRHLQCFQCCIHSVFLLTTDEFLFTLSCFPLICLHFHSGICCEH